MNFDRMNIYAENLKEFVNLRESTYGTISLVFESKDANNSMVNESMISYYLSRVFDLPKDKFRFISCHTFVQEAHQLQLQKDWDIKKTVHRPQAEIEMTKMVVEIIEDQKSI
jgi:hypothetical protein